MTLSCKVRKDARRPSDRSDRYRPQSARVEGTRADQSRQRCSTSAHWGSRGPRRSPISGVLQVEYGIAPVRLPEPGTAVGREAPPREHPRQRVLRRRWRRDTSRPEGTAPAPVPDWVCPWGDASVASGPDHLRFYGLLLTCHAPARESQVPKSPRSAHSAAQGRSSVRIGTDGGDPEQFRGGIGALAGPCQSHSGVRTARSSQRRPAAAVRRQQVYRMPVTGAQGHVAAGPRRRPHPQPTVQPPWDGTGERS